MRRRYPVSHGFLSLIASVKTFGTLAIALRLDPLVAEQRRIGSKLAADAWISSDRWSQIFLIGVSPYKLFNLEDLPRTEAQGDCCRVSNQQVVECPTSKRDYLMASPAHSPSVICFGSFELDAANGELRKAGISLKYIHSLFAYSCCLRKNPDD